MVMNNLWPPINMRDYPNFTRATIEEHSLKGEWKMPHLGKSEAVDEEFSAFNPVTVVYFSSIEGSGLKGSWRYV